MTYKPEKFISSFSTDRNSLIYSLISKINQLDELALLLKKLLPLELVDHVTVANFRQGCLVLQADNGGWATRLRYQTADLLRCLRTEGKLPQLTSIQIIVRPPDN